MDELLKGKVELLREKFEMFNKDKLKSAINKYKAQFVDDIWPKEKYKWEAVKCFQENWDIEASDFEEMFSKAFAQTGVLLNSYNYYPYNMLIGYIKKAPAEVRDMFKGLFDESKDVYERISTFKKESKHIHDKYDGRDVQHFQYENAISTYLWLRYPDKYYIYKFKQVSNVASELESDYTFRQGKYHENLKNFLALYSNICDELKQDKELKNMLISQLTETCYSDPELKTLTSDFGYFISTRLNSEGTQGGEEHPDDEGGQDNPVEQRPRFWKISHGTDYISEALAEKLEQRKGIVVSSNAPSVGKSNTSQGDNFVNGMKKGDFFYLYQNHKIRLLGRINSDEVHQNFEKQKDWCERSYTLIKIARSSNRYKDDKKWWSPNFNSTCIEVPAHENKEFETRILKPYFDITIDELLKTDIPEEKSPVSTTDAKIQYTKADFLNEVYMTENDYDRLAAVLKKKKNIILQGAPGVGKTFAAKRLAYSIMGEIDEERIEFVQFHQNYSYEDFMMGYKPAENGFELKNGVFYRFCQKAADNLGDDYFFIIDEINRGNLSKIFGELLMLIEADYRDKKITLAYNEIPFSVPNNLYIIGMMNTADRSLAMIDYALRRRFSFFEMEPGFDSQGFVNYCKDLNNDTFDRLIDCIKDLNQVIIQDESLGKGFCIGHSYFCNWTAANCTDEWMKNVVDFDILPMLSEYWFDENSTLQTWEANLHGVFK